MRNRAFDNCCFMEIVRKFLFPSSRDEQSEFEFEFDGVLPRELMVEILQRLPIKPLMRFLAVSRTWHSAIFSPVFVEKHRSYHQDKVIGFLHRYDDIRKGVSLISKKIDGDDGNPIEIETRVDVPLPSDILSTPNDIPLGKGLFSKIYLLGCSNGLVCIRMWEETFFCSGRTCFGLWNPATRKFKLLPSPEIAMYWEPDDHELRGTIDGFCYIPRIGDYKVVRIVLFKDKRSADYNERFLARALVLNVATKSWRELENYELPCTHFNYQFVVANGCLHLLVFRLEGDDPHYHASLLSFDLDEEKFRHTSVPYPCTHLNCANKCWRMLTVYKENLAMFVSPNFRANEYDGVPNNNEADVGGLGYYFELWVYDGSTFSWTKQFRFGRRLERRSYPLGFWRTGEIVIRKNYYKTASGKSTSVDAYLYNPDSNATRVIPSRESKGCSLVCHSFVESLVHV